MAERIGLEDVNDTMKSFINCFIRSVSDKNNKLVYKCLIVECNASYEEKTSAIRHIRVKHSAIYHAIQNNKNKAHVEQKNDNKTFQIRVKINLPDIWNACADLIIFNALPICFVDYPAFKKIIYPYTIALKSQGIDLTINQKNIKDLINKRAMETRKVITSEVKSKVICLMIDIATRFNRSLLGISITFNSNGKTCIRTLGMHVLRVSHTGSNIVEIIKTILSDFEISLNQVLSVTSDNGKNMMKSIALLDACYQESTDDSISANNMNVNEGNDAGSDDDDVDSAIFDADYYLDLLTNIRGALSDQIDYVDLIHGISCAAHCINLVVRNAIMKCDETTIHLERCRALVKKLRTPTYKMLIEREKLHVARIDQDTRWNSIYLMVNQYL